MQLRRKSRLFWSTAVRTISPIQEWRCVIKLSCDFHQLTLLPRPVLTYSTLKYSTPIVFYRYIQSLRLRLSTIYKTWSSTGDGMPPFAPGSDQRQRIISGFSQILFKPGFYPPDFEYFLRWWWTNKYVKHVHFKFRLGTTTRICKKVCEMMVQLGSRGTTVFFAAGDMGNLCHNNIEKGRRWDLRPLQNN